MNFYSTSLYKKLAKNLVLLHSPVEILANLKKNRANYKLVLFMQNFIGNSMVHLVKFFLLGKRSSEQKCKCRYFEQNQIFTDSVLSAGVLKLAITTMN